MAIDSSGANGKSLSPKGLAHWDQIDAEVQNKQWMPDNKLLFTTLLLLQYPGEEEPPPYETVMANKSVTYLYEILIHMRDDKAGLLEKWEEHKHFVEAKYNQYLQNRKNKDKS